jgi:hypothetical protein
MGGTDDPDNLIELSIEEHAEAHKKLFEQYGKLEDRLAWLGLSASIGKDEILTERSRIGGLGNIGKPKTEEHRGKIHLANVGKPQMGGVEEHTKETKMIISEKMKNNKNSANHRTEEYRKAQSEAMKLAWAKRKSFQPVVLV